jgi:hypothetical protein
MSNKEIIQENNSKILENNNDLSSILETINNLPTNVKIRLQEKSVIPITEHQNIVADEGYTGLSEVTVEGDSELLPENIKEGTNIFGVEGTLEIVLTKEEYVNCLEIADNILGEYDYIELEYIESTGGQYIDTGLKLAQNHKLEMTISHFDTNGNRRTFGSRASATSNNFSVVSGPVGGTMSNVADFHNYQNNRLAYVIDGDEKIDISISNKLLKINDMEKEVTTYDNFTTPDNAYLFNCSGSYPAGYESAAMRLYMCKIYENDILVRNFIPVQRKKDGEICMYDTVEKKYYLNLGTDKFIAGEGV